MKGREQIRRGVETYYMHGSIRRDRVRRKYDRLINQIVTDVSADGHDRHGVERKVILWIAIIGSAAGNLQGVAVIGK